MFNFEKGTGNQAYPIHPERNFQQLLLLNSRTEEQKHPWKESLFSGRNRLCWGHVVAYKHEFFFSYWNHVVFFGKSRGKGAVKKMKKKGKESDKLRSVKEKNIPLQTPSFEIMVDLLVFLSFRVLDDWISDDFNASLAISPIIVWDLPFTDQNALR